MCLTEFCDAEGCVAGIDECFALWREVDFVGVCDGEVCEFSEAPVDRLYQVEH